MGLHSSATMPTSRRLNWTFSLITSALSVSAMPQLLRIMSITGR